MNAISFVAKLGRALSSNAFKRHDPLQKAHQTEKHLIHFIVNRVSSPPRYFGRAAPGFEDISDAVIGFGENFAVIGTGGAWVR